MGAEAAQVRDRPPRAEERRSRVSELLAEHEVVVLTRDLPDEGIRAGDVGVVLLAHPGRDGVPPGYTVEVTTVTGETVAVVDVAADMVRPAAKRDIRHARPAASRP
jgi:hypothetical protein